MMRGYFLITFLFVVSILQGQLVDKTPAPVPVAPSIYNTEPWEDPLVSGINRDPSRATAYSFSNVADALNGNRNQSRMMSLNGEWDFFFALKPDDAPKDFYKIRLFKNKSKLIPEDLEEFFTSWKNRVPQRSLLLTLVKDGSFFGSRSLVDKKENIKVIEKYKKLGVIKRLEIIEKTRNY